jgi:hypothetical protein
MLKSFKDSDKRKYIKHFGIALSLILVAVIVVAIASSYAHPNTGSLLDNQKVEGLLFSKMELKNNYLTVHVKNVNKKKYNLKNIDVTFKDISGKKIVTLYGYIGNSLDIDEEKIMTVGTDLDLSKASSIEYDVKK